MSLLIRAGFMLLYIAMQLTVAKEVNEYISLSVYQYAAMFIVMFRSAIKLKYSSHRRVKLVAVALISAMQLWTLYMRYHKVDELYKYSDVVVMYALIVMYFGMHSPSCKEDAEEFETSEIVSNVFNFIYKYVMIHMMYLLFSMQSDYQFNVRKIKKIDYVGLATEVFKQSTLVFGYESICGFMKNDSDVHKHKKIVHRVIDGVKERVFYFVIVLICKLVYLILINGDACSFITSKIDEMFGQPHNIIITNMFGNSKETKFKLCACFILFFLK